MRHYVYLTAALLLGCVNSPHNSPVPVEIVVPEVPLFEDRFFGQKPSIISVQELVQLTPRQKQNFLKYFNNEAHQNVESNRRIFDYLKNHLSNFGYFTGTLTASEALSGDNGNCLSLAILTKALANIADVDVGYQLVATPPLFERSGGIVLRSQHVRTLLYAPRPKLEKGFFLFRRNRITVDYFPVAGSHLLRAVNENEFYSMYFINKAAQSLVKKDLNLTFWLLKSALVIDKNNPEAINMMAIVHDRLGSPEQAEKLYRHGIQYSDNKFSLLHNYQLLLERQNRKDEASVIARKLARYDQPDPFKWIDLGDRKYAEGDFSAAIHYFKKAIKLAEYLHEPYMGIAKAEFSRGNLNRAKRAMEKALEKAKRNETISLYQRKYDALSKLVTLADNG